MTDNEYLRKLGAKIRKYRKMCGMTQRDLAIAAGYTDPSSIAQIEKGVNDIPRDRFVMIAEALGLSVPQLLFDADLSKTVVSAVSVPVLGQVAAGIPIDAIEYHEGAVEISEQLANSGEFFGLRIKGHSMEPFIMDNDIVIIRSQNYADSGDIVVVAIDGELATCKRYQKQNGVILLISENAAYRPIIITPESHVVVSIIGRVVEVRRAV